MLLCLLKETDPGTFNYSEKPRAEHRIVFYLDVFLLVFNKETNKPTNQDRIVPC